MINIISCNKAFVFLRLPKVVGSRGWFVDSKAVNKKTLTRC